MKQYKKLYWAETHSQMYKGLVIANSAREARRTFANYRHGYMSSVDVARIKRLPANLQDIKETIPSDKTILDCGLEIVDLKSNHQYVSILKRNFNKHSGRVFVIKAGPQILAFQERNGF